MPVWTAARTPASAAGAGWAHKRYQQSSKPPLKRCRPLPNAEISFCPTHPPQMANRVAVPSVDTQAYWSLAVSFSIRDSPGVCGWCLDTHLLRVRVLGGAWHFSSLILITESDVIFEFEASKEGSYLFYRVPTGSSQGVLVTAEGGSIGPCAAPRPNCYLISSPRTSAFVAFARMPPHHVPLAEAHAQPEQAGAEAQAEAEVQAQSKVQAEHSPRQGQRHRHKQRYRQRYWQRYRQRYRQRQMQAEAHNFQAAGRIRLIGTVLNRMGMVGEGAQGSHTAQYHREPCLKGFKGSRSALLLPLRVSAVSELPSSQVTERERLVVAGEL